VILILTITPFYVNFMRLQTEDSIRVAGEILSSISMLYMSVTFGVNPTVQKTTAVINLGRLR
jgi:hypothetical protein